MHAERPSVSSSGDIAVFSPAEACCPHPSGPGQYDRITPQDTRSAATDSRTRSRPGCRCRSIRWWVQQSAPLDLQGEMESERLVQRTHEVGVEGAEENSHTFDGDRSHLLGLGFRVPREPSRRGVEQHLEGVDVGGVRRDQNEADSTPPKAFRRGVGAVVADHDCGSLLVRLCVSRRIEVDQTAGLEDFLKLASVGPFACR